MGLPSREPDPGRFRVRRSVAMKLSGHKADSVYRRYRIVDESDLQEARFAVCRGDRGRGHAERDKGVKLGDHAHRAPSQRDQGVEGQGSGEVRVRGHGVERQRPGKAPRVPQSGIGGSPTMRAPGSVTISDFLATVRLWRCMPQLEGRPTGRHFA